MSPNEKAIQSRAKEAFGIKINSSLWDTIIDTVHKGNTTEEEKQMTMDIKIIN